jgi:hypothetical protein
MVVDEAQLPVDPGHLDDGRLVDAWSSEAVMRVRNQRWAGEPDDVLQNYLGLPVYSTRLKQALERQGISGIQYLATRVVGFGSVELQTYYIANIVEMRPALDLATSDFDVFSSDYFLPDRRGRVSGVRRATLLWSHLRNCDVLRLAQYPASIYVSERFKSAFELEGCSGYSFEPVVVLHDEK